MKSSPNARPQQNTPNKHGPLNNNKPRPEIRDNLDHREGEEQQTKGNDTTHNAKQTKADKLKDKNK